MNWRATICGPPDRQAAPVHGEVVRVPFAADHGGAQGDCPPARAALQWHMPEITRRRSPERRQQKITLGEMRASGVRGLLIYCSDYKCSHSTAISGDRWPDDVRLSDIEPRFTCQVCGQRGADVRPHFGWEEKKALT